MYPDHVEHTVLCFPVADCAARRDFVVLDSSRDQLRYFPFSSWFRASPTECAHCPKAYYAPDGVTDHAYSFLIECPHEQYWGPDIVPPLTPNNSVAALLGAGHRTCLGTLLVVKHMPYAQPDHLDKNLRLLDLDEDDIPRVNCILKQWLLSLVKQPYASLKFFPFREVYDLYVPDA
ncbi:hypothetical protein GGX14DRAFT_565987 [Mycena pura]|uniref:Uncharacterized protein n=1 Tax=Mycena pura TaxID=153505 RepID=A0AAD6VD36_9AGAR|nr:hypothetical protein GGX14DRAFT_565987 [Mycena pura]